MKKLIAILLTLVLLCGSAMPAFAFPKLREGIYKDDTFGIVPGYVRVKQRVYFDGESTVFITRKFDKQGHMLKETETYKTPEEYSVTSKTKCTYDENGNLTKEANYYQSYSTISTYTYDDAGKVTKVITKEIQKNTQDNPNYKATTTYAYNKAGELAKEITRDNYGVHATAYTYNKLGKLAKKAHKSTDEDNSISTTTTTYAYDKNGNNTKMLVVEKQTGGNIIAQKQTFVYNEKNLCVKMTETFSQKFSSGQASWSRWVTTYAYDKNGNITKEVSKSTDSDGFDRFETTTNTYDRAGNKIKEVDTEAWEGYSCKSTVTYTYKAGRLVKQVTAFEDVHDYTDKTIETYSYDKAGNVTKYSIVSYYNDGETTKEVITCAYQKIGA